MMTIRIRTLQKDTFNVQVPVGSTVGQLKQAIQKEKGHEESWQKIIFSGKILADDKTLESYSVTENDFCVLMIKKPTTTTTTQPTTQPTTTTTTQPTTTTTTTTTQPTTQPTTTTTTQPTTQPTTTSTTTQPSTETTTTGGDNLQKIGEEQIVTKKEDIERLIQQLVEMGFDKEQAMLALKASFYNLSRAVDYLMSGEIPNIPETRPVMGGNVRPPQTGGNVRPPQTGGNVRPPQTGGNTTTGGGNVPINLWEEAQQGGGQQSGEGQQGGGVFDFLRGNREFDTLRFLVQQRPEMLQPLLQNIGQVQPQLLQLISQHQEEFTRLLNEPVDPSTLNLPQQRPTQNVQLTEEERGALNRLMDLGFDQQSALEAYLTCDKNEELAANYLLEHGSDFMDEGGDGEGGEGGYFEGEGDEFDEGGDNN